MPTKVPTHRKVRENKSVLVPGKTYRGIVLAVDPYSLMTDSKVLLVIQVDRAQFPDHDLRSTMIDESRVEVIVKDAH